jgi:glycosyltransferase involved in cell wall biosynthesis
MTQARILIGMPAFRGADVIREALESISKQDHSEFRVLISVDGEDSETAAACASFLTDPRFSLVLQHRHLGWAGNINWLMAQPDYDFFCYWQHDDYTTSNYISELLDSSTVHPDAVCYFSGIKWFGLRNDWMSLPSITGSAINRSLVIFETLNGVPFRGLIRKNIIDRVGSLRITAFDSAFEELVWLAKVAREGNLHYVDGPVYFKRAYDESIHAKWHKRDRLWKRAVWLQFGLGMLETIWPVVAEEERLTALATVIDRLCIAKEGRFLFYDGPTIPFASDFLAKALQQFSIPSVDNILVGQTNGSFAGGAAGALLGQAINWSRRGQPQNGLHQEATFHFRAGGMGIDLLVTGWSSAENWGTWSDGRFATLRLPVSGYRGAWKANITFTAFGKEGTEVRLKVGDDSASPSIMWTVPAQRVVQKELHVESQLTDVTLQFSLPNAISPFQLGVSTDRRLLGIGLISLNLRRLF